MQKSSSRAVTGAGRVALGPEVRSEELEAEVGGLGRGIDSILLAGGSTVLAAAVGPAVATSELAATAASGPVPAATKSGRNGFASAK